MLTSSNGLASLGIEASAVADFIEEISSNYAQMFAVMRYGKIAAKGSAFPYRTDEPRIMYSVSKSFTAIAACFAVSEGKLSFSSKVIDLFPEYAGIAAEGIEKLTLHDLLIMGVGRDYNTNYIMSGEDWVKNFFTEPIQFAPGEKFIYDTSSTYMASAMVSRSVGECINDYLTPRLFSPLGIENHTWDKCPAGYNVGGYGLCICPEDVLKVCHMLMHKGEYNNERIISEEYVNILTAYQIDNSGEEDSNLYDWISGYGYQVWRCRRDNTFRFDGAFGQFFVMMPDIDTAVFIGSATTDTKQLLDSIWNKLLPGIKDAPLSTEQKDVDRLKQVLSLWSIPLPTGTDTVVHSWIYNCRYSVSPNVIKNTFMALSFFDTDKLGINEIDFDFGDEDKIRLVSDGAEMNLIIAHGQWNLYGDVAISGAWQNYKTYHARIVYTFSPHIDDIYINFEECFGDAEIRLLRNITFQPENGLFLAKKIR